MLMIGQQNELVNRFLQRHSADQFAFLTAWNPQSRPLADDENRRRNQQLATDLAAWPFLLGTTHGPDETWPGEESFFVVGLPRDRAIALANRFDQNAILYGTLHAPVELVFANEAAYQRCLRSATP